MGLHPGAHVSMPLPKNEGFPALSGVPRPGLGRKSCTAAQQRHGAMGAFMVFPGLRPCAPGSGERCIHIYVRSRGSHPQARTRRVLFTGGMGRCREKRGWMAQPQSRQDSRLGARAGGFRFRAAGIRGMGPRLWNHASMRRFASRKTAMIANRREYFHAKESTPLRIHHPIFSPK